MATIRNTTPRPLKISLPGGKLLRLGPRKDAEVSAKAVDHPSVIELVEAGDVEILQRGKSGGNRSGSTKGLSGATGRSGDKTIRKTGDG